MFSATIFYNISHCFIQSPLLFDSLRECGPTRLHVRCGNGTLVDVLSPHDGPRRTDHLQHLLRLRRPTTSDPMRHPLARALPRRSLVLFSFQLVGFSLCVGSLASFDHPLACDLRRFSRPSTILDQPSTVFSLDSASLDLCNTSQPRTTSREKVFGRLSVRWNVDARFNLPH